jgi:hypothetical protein
MMIGQMYKRHGKGLHEKEEKWRGINGIKEEMGLRGVHTKEMGFPKRPNLRVLNCDNRLQDI